ncbi:Uncharacterised protein [Mycobacterium tuberculosis]|nr:Uncharacterised protein [Mycobacterium tuberculosis]COW34883.1 Uncharacterised protein [Mycobacterium tuberculosis]
MLGGVHRFGPLVQQRETPPDDGVPHFADRHGAGYRTRPAQPQQAVFPVNSSMLVRQSTRSTPSHKVSVCV